MQQRSDLHIFQGLQVDIDPLKQKPEYLSDARNIRLSTSGNSTLMSVTPEKSTELQPISFSSDTSEWWHKYVFHDYGVGGSYLGHCVIGEQLILFSKNRFTSYDSIAEEERSNIYDSIYSINLKDFSARLINNPSITKDILNFNEENPIQCVPWYENKLVQKVYWTDNLNQLRVINVSDYQDPETKEFPYNNWVSYDFAPSLQLKEEVAVYKNLGDTGSFASGVIQYCFTYYNKYGQETSIAYTTPLIYITEANRAGSPEESIKQSITIKIDNVDTNFDFLRLYSIHRTSLDKTPNVKVVSEVRTKSTLTINDTGLIGYNIDPSELLYKNGNKVTAKSIAIKDNTFFIGNISPFNSNYLKAKNLINTYFVKEDEQRSLKKVEIKAVEDSYPEFSALSTYELRVRALHDEALISDKNTKISKLHSEIDEIIVNLKNLEQDISIYNARMRELEAFMASNPDSLLFEEAEREYGDLENKLRAAEEEQSANNSQKRHNEGVIELLTDEIAFLDKEIAIINAIIAEREKDEEDVPSAPEEGGNPDDYEQEEIQNKILYSSYRIVPLDYDESQLENDASLLHIKYPFSLNGKKQHKDADGNIIGDGEYINTSSFKRNEWYRLGIQFQDETGNWSSPIYIQDYKIPNIGQSLLSRNDIILPTIKFKITDALSASLKALNYKKARPLVVFPSIEEREVITQGVVCPTVYSVKSRKNNSPYWQSSWFIRPFYNETIVNKWVWGNLESTFPSPVVGTYPLKYKHNSYLTGGVHNINNKNSEIDGLPQYVGRTIEGDTDVQYTWFNSKGEQEYLNLKSEDYNSFFRVDQNVLTMHSADIEFDKDNFLSLNLDNSKFRVIGYVEINKNCSNLDVQTTSPTAGSASGFTNVDAIGNGYSVRSSGPLYNDNLIENFSNGITLLKNNPVNFWIYPWQKQGSLNNDATRTANQGQQTAVLSKKVLANYKLSNTTTYLTGKEINDIPIENPIIFNSDVVSIQKINNKIYYGNVDTLLEPGMQGHQLFSIGKEGRYAYGICEDGAYSLEGANHASLVDESIIPLSKVGSNGDTKLRVHSGSVRMKYKSSPHIIVRLKKPSLFSADERESLEDYYNENGGNKELDSDANLPFTAKNTHYNPILMLAELYRDQKPTFGGSTAKDLQNNLWIPAGEAVSLTPKDSSKNKNVYVEWKYGDTFYQRFDFLKTYPFTKEDLNEVVEIGSFLGEFRVNADGRYDKNKCQSNNLNCTPQNFNLHNPVYNQTDNFFNYRIMDNDYYKVKKHPNTISWTLPHTPQEEIDSWTNITLASTLALDGSKGEITKLATTKSQIYSFQEYGISSILYNSRIQLSASDGVPIEISNSNRVEGFRYIADYVGLKDFNQLTSNADGLYFIDSNSKELHFIGDNGLMNISSAKGMTSWFKKLSTTSWNINNTESIKLFYDYFNQDLYIKEKDCLVLSEKLQQFESFMDYGDMVGSFVYEGIFYALTNDKNSNTIKLWKMHYKDEPCRFFDNKKGCSLSFYSNADSLNNKIFSTMDMNVDWMNLDDLGNASLSKEDCFFDTFRISNEYQDSKPLPLVKIPHTISSIKNKFRTWRITIPRDKAFKRDRIQNNWAKITLSRENTNDNKIPFILHNIEVKYFI